MPMRSPTGSDNRMRRLASLTPSEASGPSASRPVAPAEAGDGDQCAGAGDRQFDERQTGDAGEVEHGDDGEHRRRDEPGPREPPELLTASSTITSGATNGSIVTNAGCGSPNGPSHHVLNPSSRLVFHTAT